MILTVFFLLTKILQAMRTYGYEIVQTLIVDIKPNETIKRAMTFLFFSFDCERRTNRQCWRRVSCCR